MRVPVLVSVPLRLSSTRGLTALRIEREIRRTCVAMKNRARKNSAGSHRFMKRLYYLLL